MKKKLFLLILTISICNISYSKCDDVTVTIKNTDLICEGSPTTFTATITGSNSTATYKWYIDSDTPVETNTNTFTYTPLLTDNGKSIRVSVNSPDFCTADVMSNTMQINVSASTSSVSITTSPNPTCDLGIKSVFSVNTTTGAGSDPLFQWYINSDPVGTGETSFSEYVTDGDEIWVSMAGSECVASEALSNVITMDIRPIPSSKINEGNQTICAGESFTFTATVGAGTTLQWINTSGNIAGATNTSYTATESGTYSITESNGICSTQAMFVALTLDPCNEFSTSIYGPNQIAPGQQNAVYSVSDKTGFSYNWSVTDGTIVSGQNTHSVTVDWDANTINALARTAISSYLISVTETNTEKLSKTTSLEINTITTAVSQSLAQSRIILFPNPATESFAIQMPENGIEVSYEILDLTGVLMASGAFTSGNDHKIATDFSAGLYQVVLKYNGIVTTARLSKMQ